MEASQNKSDVTILYLVGGFVIHFAGIFHASCSGSKVIQEFLAFAVVKKFFSIFGANMTRKIFCKSWNSQKVLPRQKLRWSRHYGPGGYSRSGCRGPEE
jgi:hypothetical protein